MKDVYKIKEVQLGVIIFLIVFFSLLLSNVPVNLSLTHGLIITISAIFLVIGLINLLIITRVPNVNNISILYKNNEYFFKIYKQLYFYIYFFILTIIVSLFAEMLGGTNRGQNILTVSTFATSIYGIILSISCSYRFITYMNEYEKKSYKKYVMKDF